MCWSCCLFFQIFFFYKKTQVDCLILLNYWPILKCCFYLIMSTWNLDFHVRNEISSRLELKKFLNNSYFLHWNFDSKSCFVVFFLLWNEWKNPQFNFSSQNLSIECNFSKWDGKETKLLHLLFHRIWKNILLHSWGFIDFVRVEFKVILMSLALPCMKK